MNPTNSQNQYTHMPVLSAEALNYLNLSEGMIVLDATTGEGGHTEAILRAVGPEGKVIAMDRDEEILQVTKRRFALNGNVIIYKANFTDVADVLREAGVERVNAALFDLGISTYHFRHPERGFSFEENAPLDMRIDRSEGENAAELLNSRSEAEIEAILREYGEEPKSRAIAKAICRRRKIKPVETTDELKDIVVSATHYGKSRTHVATRTFQALRIAVNGELDNLSKVLSAVWQFIIKGGRAVFISFHSLEDRIVKNAFKAFSKKGAIRILTSKPVIPGWEEIRSNRNSRSAKLRAAEVIQ